MKLKKLDHFPSELLDAKPQDLHELLGGPSLITLTGESSQTIFISCLLHGNEHSSFSILKELLRDYKDKKLPKTLMIFIGNTQAAVESLRHLPGQVDYNRIWEGGNLPENKLALEVMKEASERDLFVSLDIHNNTGKNPNYGCINYHEEDFLKLASHFSEATVFFSEPRSAHSVAFGKLCPSMTIEAGLSDSLDGIEETKKYIEYLLSVEDLVWNEKRHPLNIYQTLARIKLNNQMKIDFNFQKNIGLDFSFLPNIDDFNFKPLEAGTTIAYGEKLEMLIVEDNDGNNITSKFFEIVEGELKVKHHFMPAMLTKVEYIIKKDCLGYIMEPMPKHHTDEA